MSTYTKYIDALAKMDDIISTGKDVKVSHSKGKYITEQEDEFEMCHKLWDELYEFVYANFKAPASTRTIEDAELGKSVKESLKAVTPEVEEELESMRKMFKLNREEIEEQLYEIPPVILEQCFPVWMARYMLAFGQVPVTPVKLTTFDEFHNMYGYMIIYAY